MSFKPKFIPLNTFPDVESKGIIIERSSVEDLELDKIRKAHRDNYHLFFILEQGSGIFEVDFRQYTIVSPSIIYIQPYQVHRGISFKEGFFTVILINDENLNTEYLDLLKTIAPADPLQLQNENFDVLSDTIAICLKIYKDFERKLYYPILKNSCNALIGLIISNFLGDSAQINSPNRSQVIMSNFKSLLENQFLIEKNPKFYAEQLNITTSYLNECAKKATGETLSYHIQQRIILEAKRLLFHSSKSVKEIAYQLGYEDYSYFSRLFIKATGMTALTFRKKSFE
ncbi:AraC family transcriptional regulator [Chryseobacterium sp. NKUCC03_KSP]|uniref:AraC family transcriptional regulator n=1 Tax=Chryseobacterium sp. NKUCC03_KSP TaxID=2842125 RepID=UPI001C5B255E|nr:helix-turn-helix transcriptional regulator [Chryseobacterium sp. NKUCC03_KSP]MBW3524354.1 AraC family transcriptional regulator [Chryseobacterium sp. NKUCC03_KSP]